MSVDIPSDFAPFVRRLIAERRFLSETEVVIASLQLLQDQEELDDKLQEAIHSLDQGQGIRAEEVFAKARNRIAEVERGEL